MNPEPSAVASLEPDKQNAGPILLRLSDCWF